MKKEVIKAILSLFIFIFLLTPGITKAEEASNFYELEYWIDILDDLYNNILLSQNSENVSQYDIVSSEDSNNIVDIYGGKIDYDIDLYSNTGLGNLPINFKLTYKNESHYKTQMGYNMQLNLEKFLTFDSDDNVTFHDGEMGTYTFEDQFFGYSDNYLLQSELEKNSDEYIISKNNGISYIFDLDGKIKSIKDGYGVNEIKYFYNSNGSISSIKDTINNNYNFVYSNGLISSITLPYQEEIDFSYTSEKLDNITWNYPGTNNSKNISLTYSGTLLDEVRDFENNIILKNTYDSDLKIISQNNGEDTNTYNYGTDSSGRFTNTVTNKSGTQTIYTYNSNGTVKQKEIIKSGTNTIYKYEYYDNGLLKNEILPYYNGYTYKYDNNGNLLEKRMKSHIRNTDNDLEDLVTTYTYNSTFNIIESITYPNGSVESFIYNDKADLTRHKIVDLNNNILKQKDITYYSTGLIGTEKNLGEELITYTYDTDKISSETKGTHVTSYEYDIYGNIGYIRDANNNSTDYTVDAYHNIIKETTQEGNITEYVYNLNNDLTQKSYTIGNEKVNIFYKYNNAGNLVEERQETSEGNYLTTNYTYANNDGLLTKKEIAGGVKIEYEYTENGLLKKQKTYNDGKVNTTSYIYDKADRLKQEITDNGNKTYYYYDNYNNLERKKLPDNSYYQYRSDEMGNTIKTEIYDENDTLLSREYILYDGINRKKEIANYLSEENRYITTKNEYSQNGELSKIILPNNDEIIYSYDIYGRNIYTTYPDGKQEKLTYDSVGNITKKEILLNGDSVITNYTYDDDYRLIYEETGGIISVYNYNSLGQITASQLGNDTPTYYEYDYIGNLLKETTGDIITNYSYDIHSNMTQVIDPNNNIINYEYDDLGNLVKHTYPDNSFTIYTYNDMGEKIQEIDALGTIVDYVYDKLGRLRNTYIDRGTDVDGVSYEGYDYDTLGRLVYSKNSDSELFFEYDTLGRLIKETNAGAVVEYEYDDLGNKTKVIYPDGREVKYNYTDSIKLSSIQNNNETIVNYTYTGLGLSEKLYNNSTKTNYSYDSAQRLNTLKTQISGNELISDFTYTYDTKGNITKDDVREYFYDTNNRLKEIYQDKYVNSTGYDVTKGKTYDYDNAGNRLKRIPFIRGVKDTNSWESTYDITDYTVNNLNQYTNYTVTDDEIIETDVDFIYDVTGNLIEDDKYKYSYDYKNRLTKLEYLSTGYRAYSYRYDPLGRRVYREKQTERIDYFYAGKETIKEEWKQTDSDGNVLNTTTYEYINGLNTDDVLLRITTQDLVETTHYYHKNHLGSIVAITDSSGNLVEKYSYDEFGDPKIWDDSTNTWEWYQSPINNTRLFTGRDYNTYTKLYYNRARYYAPRLGVFISRDPIDIDDDVNLYAYVKNRPVVFVDPMGENGILSGYEYGLLNLTSGILGIIGNVIDNIQEGIRELNNNINYDSFIQKGDILQKTGFAGVTIGLSTCAYGSLATAGGGTIPSCVIGGSVAIGGVGVGLGGTFMKGVGEFGKRSQRGKNLQSRKNFNQIKKDIKKGKAPKDVNRIDFKYLLKYEKNHIHFNKNNSALNIDGNWKHGGKKLSKREIEWLKSIGWKIPK